MYRGNSDNPMGMAMQGMNFLSGAMRTGQAIGEERYQTDERDGVNKAYDYIVGKLGNDGDMSMLNGDPILNTRHGAMGAGLFEQQRLSNQTARLGFLQKRAAADTELYENTIRPMMGAATEAYKSGDMQRFGLIAGELSKKFPFPYRYTLGEDGMFKEEFRSDKHEGWVDTNGRITPQQAYAQLEGLMRGEQKILVGANMQTKYVNPDFLAMSSRYAMGTAMKNAQNLADPKNHIPLTKNGKTMYAVIQNRHDDYSAEPSFYVMDESGQNTGYYTGQQLIEMGFVRSDVKASTEKAQRLAAGSGGAGGAGASPYKLSEAQNKWIASQATSKDEFGNETTDPAKGMILEMLMGMFGQSQYSALQAYQEAVLPVMEQLRKEDPNISAAQAQQVASGRYYNWLMQKSQGAQNAPTTPSSAGNSPKGAPQEEKPNGNLKLRKEIQDVAGGNGQAATPATEEPITPEEQHRRIVDGGVELTRAIPGALRDGFEWWKNSIKNNAE